MHVYFTSPFVPGNHRVRKVFCIPGTEGINRYVIPSGCWELNTGPPKGEKKILNAVPSLQHHKTLVLLVCFLNFLYMQISLK